MSPFARLHCYIMSLHDTQSAPPNARRQRPAAPRGFADALLIACAFLLADPAFAADWYASPTGAGTYDCMSEANACAGIQAAIAIAVANDTVHVSAGNYAEKVVVNKALTLLGPHAGVHGSDPTRSAGEAIIKPASGVSVSLNADMVTLDGFTVQALDNAGLLAGTGNGVKVLNSRFVDSVSRGIYVERSLLQPSTDWLIEGNLFDTLVGSSSTAIVMARSTNLKILGNVIRNVTYQGVQLSNAMAAEIRGNNISDTDFDGINVASSENVVIAGNTISSVNRLSGAGRGAVRLYDEMIAVSVSCNNIDASNAIDATNGGIVLRNGTTSGLKVFHNAIIGGTSVISNWTAGADIGSNWYGGSAVSVGGGNAADLHIADALSGNPIADTRCGTNAPVEIVDYAGTGNQSTVVDSAFSPLRARVQDVLGGAVAGQFIELTANTHAGATATLGTSSGNSNYNGELISTATANSVAGSYTVDAKRGTFSTVFNLTNTLVPDITLQLNGPIADVHVGQPAQYVGILRADPLPAANELFFVKVRLHKSTGPMVTADLQKMEILQGIEWIDSTDDITFVTDVDYPDDLVYFFPKPLVADGFPINEAEWSWQFRFTYAEAAIYTATAQVIHANDSSPASAPVSIYTEVIPPSPNISLQLNGPVAGVEMNVPAAYIGTLTNTGPALAENAFVRVRVAMVGEVLVLGDLTAEVSDGNGNWIEGTLTPVNDGLEVDFPSRSGFPIDANFAFTHQFRITYHRLGVFSATASVIGVGTETVYATSGMYTQVVPRGDVVAGIMINPASLHGEYDGLSHVASATTTPTGLPLTFSYNGLAGAPVNAGQYVVVASVNAAPYVGSASAILVLDKAPSTVTIDPTDLYQSAGMTFPVGAIANPTSTGSSIEVTYNGSNTVPSAVGSYTVVATLVDPNYVGSASGVLHIGAGEVEFIAVNGPPSFTGIAGQLLAYPLPSVKVTDNDGNPVAGVVVNFTAGVNSGVLSGAVQITDSNGIATLGGWILDPTPGVNTLAASAAGVTGAVTFNATGSASAGALSVSITDGRRFTKVGQALTYTIVVANSGTSNLTSVAVSDTLPPELDAAGATWQCIPVNGAVCAGGNGDLVDTINLPVGSSVVYLLSTTVVEGPNERISNTVAATGVNGTVSANDITDTVLFRDGFEIGGDGAQAVGGELTDMGSLSQQTSIGLHLQADALGSVEVVSLASSRDGAFRVEAIAIDGPVWLRLVARAERGEQASMWTRFDDEYAMLMLDGSDLLLIGSSTELLITLDRGGEFSLSQPLN